MKLFCSQQVASAIADPNLLNALTTSTFNGPRVLQLPSSSGALGSDAVVTPANRTKAPETVNNAGSHGATHTPNEKDLNKPKRRKSLSCTNL